jgi:hypothetical protein
LFYKEKKNPVQHIFYFAQIAQFAMGELWFRADWLEAGKGYCPGGSIEKTVRCLFDMMLSGARKRLFCTVSC